MSDFCSDSQRESFFPKNQGFAFILKLSCIQRVFIGWRELGSWEFSLRAMLLWLYCLKDSHSSRGLGFSSLKILDAIIICGIFGAKWG